MEQVTQSTCKSSTNDTSTNNTALAHTQSSNRPQTGNISVNHSPNVSLSIRIPKPINKLDKSRTEIPMAIAKICNRMYFAITGNNETFKKLMEKTVIMQNELHGRQIMKLILSNIEYNSDHLEDLMKYYKISPAIYIGMLIHTAIHSNSLMLIANQIDSDNQSGQQEFFSLALEPNDLPSIIPSNLRHHIPTILVYMVANLLELSPNDNEEYHCISTLKKLFIPFKKICPNPKDSLLVADSCQFFKQAYELTSTMLRGSLSSIPDIDQCINYFIENSKKLNLTLTNNNHLENTSDNMDIILSCFITRLLSDKLNNVESDQSSNDHQVQLVPYSVSENDTPIRFYFDGMTDSEKSLFLDKLATCSELKSEENCMKFFRIQFRSLEFPRSPFKDYSDLEELIKIKQMLFCKTSFYGDSFRKIMTPCQMIFNLTAACFMKDEINSAVPINNLSGEICLAIATSSLSSSNFIYFEPSNEKALQLHQQCVNEIENFQGTQAWQAEVQCPTNFAFTWMYDSSVVMTPYLSFLRRFDGIMQTAYYNGKLDKMNLVEITSQLIDLNKNKTVLFREEVPILNLKHLFSKVIAMSLKNQPLSIEYPLKKALNSC